jgi:hypothetical protein
MSGLYFPLFAARAGRESGRHVGSASLPCGAAHDGLVARALAARVSLSALLGVAASNCEVSL